MVVHCTLKSTLVSSRPSAALFYFMDFMDYFTIFTKAYTVGPSAFNVLKLTPFDRVKF